MKLAFISDIHGNIRFLEQVLSAIRAEGIREIFCAGDLIGYYEASDEVVSAVREENILCVKGNHELMFLGELPCPPEKDAVYRLKQTVLSEGNRQYLSSLPLELEIERAGAKLYVTHAVPGDARKYAAQADLQALKLPSGLDVYVYGHTHRASVYYYNGVCFINPGSAGQIRDYTSSVSFAVWDTVSRTAEIHRCQVDAAGYMKYLREHRAAAPEAIEIFGRRKSE
ncbi:MAG: metallophosphoesterase family protein [Lentisphaeria bacterium]|nr:metallophosphoesterase family protein [Lentisphaeria bacterium]